MVCKKFLLCSGIGIINAIEVVNAFLEKDGLQKFMEWLESLDLTILGTLNGQNGTNSKKRKSKVKKNDGSLNRGQEDYQLEDDIDDTRQAFMDSRNVNKNWHISSSFPNESCHIHGVINRDLKLKNFLFASKKETAALKAIDFGLSVFLNLEPPRGDVLTLNTDGSLKCNIGGTEAIIRDSLGTVMVAPSGAMIRNNLGCSFPSAFCLSPWEQGLGINKKFIEIKKVTQGK
ncbi:hypothetical protein GIB67_023246 [Kingdonia uniflora]|uniref:Protein kinase domain-containing protein n=1 Tax=Kingdonia uniflora TaxID=39325 RepID=A0A7J7L4F8_9MAGN|nr:hypothetical protein GIB67_023246 [Kingdonia uniflora]